MSKNKVFLLLAFIVICVFLTGCSVADLFRSKENEEEAEKWREQAEKLAIEHIEQKYGFTPTVEKVQSNQDDSPFINFDYTSESLITMSYADVVFEVVALTFPVIFALIDFVKSLLPSFLGPTPVQPEPVQAAC